MKFFYVYILQSDNFSNHFYIGLTEDLKQRLKEHNADKCPHTKKYSPWKIKNFFAFLSQKNAFEFEKYLKTSSGRAFTKKHF